MRVIDQFWTWEHKPENPLERIEAAARTCYQSQPKKCKACGGSGDIGTVTEVDCPECEGEGTTTSSFIRGLIRSGHHSTLEHVSASVRIVTDRGVTHELVRHRLASYSQESTRYCNYGSKEIEFVRPVDMWTGSFPSHEEAAWEDAMAYAERAYNKLLSLGAKPQLARSVLPNSLKTEIVVTANLREWRHIFTLRCAPAAHPQFRALASDMLREFKREIPVVFNDVEVA